MRDAGAADGDVSWRGALAGATLAFCAAISPGARADDGNVVHRVIIAQFRFEPSSLTIRSGDTVEWINRDLAPHTATDVDRQWKTGTLMRGETARMTFDTAGRLDYTCVFHPHMRATIDVVAADR